MRLVEAVAKKKSRLVDLVLLGELRPSGEYLNASVALATSDPKQAIAFLKGNGFTSASLEAFHRRNSIEVQSMSSSGFRATMLNLMRESEDSSNTAVIARRSHPIKEKAAHHWLVDKTASGSFATTEIAGERVSPEVARLQKRRSQEG
jgi:hypothetical protein